MKLLRGLVSVLILGSVLLGISALLIRIPAFRESFVPAPVLSFLDEKGILALIGATNDAPAADPIVDESLADTHEGLVASGPVAASAGNKPIRIDAAVTGYSTRSESAVPVELTTIRPILGCMPTRPMQGSVVGHVTAGKSGMPIGMSTYNDSHLAAAVQAFVDTYRKLGPEGQIEILSPAYETYDVVVTDTSAPVFLVLETGIGNRVWNIHSVEGVTIERVVLLGGDQAGVANLDPVVPVEVILAPGLTDCGIVPAYAPTPGQIADADPAEGAQPLPKADLDAAIVRAEAYDIWFRDSFGVTASSSRVGFEVGTLSLIGPLPEGEAPKAVWKSVDGARIRTTHDEFLDIEGQVAVGQDFAGRVVEIAKRFAFGDLGLLMQGGSF